MNHHRALPMTAQHQRPTIVPTLRHAARYGLGLLILCGLLVIVPLRAQDAPPETTPESSPPQPVLAAGEPRLVQLTDTQPAVALTYTSPGGETVAVQAIAVVDSADIESDAPPDTVLRVIAPDGSQIAYADHNGADAAGDRLTTDAAIAGLSLPQAGDYIIWVSTYGEVGRGEVRVMLQTGDPFAATTTETGDSIVINGRLPRGEVFTHTLDLTAGTQITLTVRDVGGTLDPRLRLLNDANRLIAHNDDHGTPDLTLNIFDARIVTTVETGGTYTVEVSDFLGNAGRFALHIETSARP